MDIVYYSKSLSVGSGEIKKIENRSPWKVTSSFLISGSSMSAKMKLFLSVFRLQTTNDGKKTSSSDDVGDSCDGPII